MLDFSVFASSSKGNLYTLFDGHTTLMLECGLAWKRVRRELAFKTSEVAGILCTHSHGDHSRGVSDAIKAGLDVYASQETFDNLGLSGHRCKRITAGEQFKIGTWSIVPFESIHDCPGSVGFLLASGESKALFLTDSAYVHHRFRDLTHIFIEANYCPEILRERVSCGAISPAMRDRLLFSHFSIDNVLEFLKANDISKVREIHLLHLSDSNSNAEEFKKKVQSATGKPVMVAAP